MSSSASPQPPSTPAGDTPKVVQVDAGAPRLALDEQIQLIWAKHRSRIIAVCVAAIVAVVVVELVKAYFESQERAVGVAFGAADTPEKLRTFATSHESHRLAGIAWLKLGDQAYEAGRFTEAAGHYEKAARLAGEAFGARAAYGQAMSEIAAGNKTKGEPLLKTIAADAKQPAALRAEVSYQLAVLAKDAGRLEEARKLVGEAETLDGAGYWVREAAVLRMSLGEAAPAPKP